LSFFANLLKGKEIVEKVRGVFNLGGDPPTPLVDVNKTQLSTSQNLAFNQALVRQLVLEEEKHARSILQSLLYCTELI
jgi:hypothetical protein